MRRTFLTIAASIMIIGMTPTLAQQPPATTPPAQTDQQAAPQTDTSTPETTRKVRTPAAHHRFVRHYWYQWSAWPWNWHWNWGHWRYHRYHRHHS
jgi:hypothetical protein